MTVLITGASGLVGTRLTELLLQKGYTVIHLARKKDKVKKEIVAFQWDIDKQEIDTLAVQQADCIIHLAGVNIGNKRWNQQRKKEIVDSRVQSTNLLYKTLQQQPNKVKALIAASATGYYGSRNDELITETFPPGDDFLSHTCVLWENAVCRFSQLGIREVRLRTGIVLAKNGGALPRLASPIKFGIVPLLGSGIFFIHGFTLTIYVTVIFMLWSRNSCRVHITPYHHIPFASAT